MMDGREQAGPIEFVPRRRTSEDDRSRFEEVARRIADRVANPFPAEGLGDLGTLVTDRSAWLAERKNGVGASEAAAALGMSPFESPRGLYLRKLGILPEVTETEAMRWGSLLEPVIAAEYQRRSGNTILEQQVFLKSDLSPMMATVDAMTKEGFPVEFKTVSAWTARELGEEESDQLPDHWLIQGHQQMLLTSTWRVDFAVLVAGQRLQIFTVKRDEALVDAIILGVRGFWDCVQARRPPALDTRADARVMGALYPGCEGEVAMTDVTQFHVDCYMQLGREARDIAADREESRALILEALGEHAVGRLPDGRVITRRMIHIAEGIVRRKATTYPRISISRGVS